MQIYTATAFGVGVSTESRGFFTKGDAYRWVQLYRKAYMMEDVKSMYADCWKGFSKNTQCDIEIEIHQTEIEFPEHRIEEAKKVLAENGIKAEEAETVLRSIGYALLDTELFPQK